MKKERHTTMFKANATKWGEKGRGEWSSSEGGEKLFSIKRDLNPNFL